MTRITSYKDLIVWQKSIQLVKKIYILTQNFPKEEQFGLTNQLRRAVVSIPSNIAEGYGRRTLKDHNKFFVIAYGSALEVETQLVIARELKFCQEDELIVCESLLLEVIKMLNKLTSNNRPSFS